MQWHLERYLNRECEPGGIVETNSQKGDISGGRL